MSRKEYTKWYAKRWHDAKRCGETICQKTDATKSREHVKALREKGVGTVEIARRTGLCLDTLTRLQRGMYARVNISTEEAILAIPIPKAQGRKRRIQPPSMRKNHVDAEDVRAHLRWLAKHKVSFVFVSQVTGLAHSHLHQLKNGEIKWVRLETQAALFSKSDILIAAARRNVA